MPLEMMTTPSYAQPDEPYAIASYFSPEARAFAARQHYAAKVSPVYGTLVYPRCEWPAELRRPGGYDAPLPPCCVVGVMIFADEGRARTAHHDVVKWSAPTSQDVLEMIDGEIKPDQTPQQVTRRAEIKAAAHQLIRDFEAGIITDVARALGVDHS